MKMFLLLKSIFSEQRLDQRGVGRGRRGRVGVFALNYATSCGNVCHQIGERGSRGRGQRAERERQQGEQKAGAVAENEEWGGWGKHRSIVKCGGNNFTLQHKESHKRK